MKLETVKLQQILRNFVCLIVFCGISVSQGTRKEIVSSKFAATNTVPNCSNLIHGTSAFSITPEYPNEAKSAKIGGYVRVTVQIDENGKVSKILKADGHKLLLKSASEAAKRVRFTPTLCDTKPIPIIGIVTYNFSPFVFTDSYFTAQKVEDFSDLEADSKYYEPIFSLVENYRLAFGLVDQKISRKLPFNEGRICTFLKNDP